MRTLLSGRMTFHFTTPSVPSAPSLPSLPLLQKGIIKCNQTKKKGEQTEGEGIKKNTHSFGGKRERKKEKKKEYPTQTETKSSFSFFLVGRKVFVKTYKGQLLKMLLSKKSETRAESNRSTLSYICDVNTCLICMKEVTLSIKNIYTLAQWPFLSHADSYFAYLISMLTLHCCPYDHDCHETRSFRNFHWTQRSQHISATKKKRDQKRKEKKSKKIK